MGAKRVVDPLFDDAPVEIPLKNAPLIRVLAQVRFNEILSIVKEEFVAGFQEELRRTYPLFSRQDTQALTFTPKGPELRPDVSWRLTDSDGHWQVTLATSYVTLEAIRYESRSDLLRRLKEVLTAVAVSLRPTAVTRVGVRYVDRIEGAPLASIDGLVCNQLIGLAAASLRAKVQHSLTEAVCDTAEGQLLLRWGWMPANGSHDPGTLHPIAEKSWMLDIDSFKICEPSQAFDVDEIGDIALKLATRAYAFFRWSITDEFIKTYGGEP